MYIFVDESGTTDEKNKQKFLVIAFALSSNRDFPEKLILKIKDQCKIKGKPIHRKELKYHELTPFQKEIAVKQINSSYRNFYICFFDVDRAERQMVTGKYEEEIQMQSIDNVLSKLDKSDMEKQEIIRIVMDKKLTTGAQHSIEDRFKRHLGKNKGISVRTLNSSKERGIQLADLIAGAYRAKLMKKSDLFEADPLRVFQIAPKIE